MDTQDSNAPWRASTGTTPPTTGVLHVRTRLTANFTVIANALAQRPGSAVTVGVAAYILSMPDGAPVSIAALCKHFTEGEILISRALRELETAGYLERRRERGPGGRVHTRTFAYDVPGQGRPRASRPASGRAPSPPPVPPSGGPPVAADPAPNAIPPAGPTASAAPLPPSPPSPPTTGAPLPETDPQADWQAASQAEPDPQAELILASLRISDRRLVLSRREVSQLAPAVGQWLGRGLDAQQITEALTVNLPDRLRARPARILGFRLTEVPTELPSSAEPPGAPEAVALPWQTCDGPCERPFRAAEPGRCRDCPPGAGRELTAVG
ncbi:hypothetical protein ACIO1C_31700 [Streptomyces sp. NPDC087420]|uniref:hypothetical protein n=1 Tax=Streptomyces sp. NPDC087420 TaxID=3365785 RepID=UPI003836C056